MSIPTLNISGDSQQVILSNGDLTLNFYRQYGGAPLHWENSSHVGLIATFAGEGVNIVVETGNDVTQASSDGITTYPIAPITDPSSSLNYYGKEITLASPSPSRNWAQYETLSHAPFFWGSFESADDSNPVDLAHSPWNTLYNNFLHLPPSIFTGAGVPLIFAQRDTTTSGILLIGDEIKAFYNTSTPWNQSYAKIHNGNFACRMRVQLVNAAPGGIAGILFRKQVPTGAGRTLDDLYNSPGYALFLNKAGNVQFVKDNTTILWSSPTTYAFQLNSAIGLRVELRTDDAHLDWIHVYLDGVFVHTVTGLDYKYDAFGLFGQTAYGDIRFLYREVVDKNITIQSCWRAYPEYIESICAVHCDFSTLLYRLNLPILFIEPTLREWWEVKSADNRLYTMNDAFPASVAPGILPGNNVSSIWIGKQSGPGIAIKCDCGMANGHIGIGPNEVAFNTLGYDANFNPVPVVNFVLSLKYRSTRW